MLVASEGMKTRAFLPVQLKAYMVVSGSRTTCRELASIVHLEFSVQQHATILSWDTGCDSSLSSTTGRAEVHLACTSEHTLTHPLTPEQLDEISGRYGVEAAVAPTGVNMVVS